MRKVILILTLLFSLQTFGQMLKEVKEPKLYVEPQSIQYINNKWKSEKIDNQKQMTTIVVGGLSVIGLDIYNFNYVEKRPTNNGWVYRPLVIKINTKNK